MQVTIKAVVFDYGDVIWLHTGDSPLKIASDYLHIPLEDIRKAYFERNHLANVNNTDWFEMFRSVLADLGADLQKQFEVIALIQQRSDSGHLNTELLELIPRLRELGLKIGILSNAASALRGRLEQLGIADIFDAVVISGEIGFQKPHKEAFEVLFERLGLLPKEVVFVDDSSKSLEKAAEIGYVPVLYRNNEQLKADLIKEGILL